MNSLRIIEDYDECRSIWNRTIPRHTITDLWEVRDCFHKHYQNQPRFVAKEAHGMILGLLPLSWIEDVKVHGFFPGEIWQGKTWLEQNRIYAMGSWGRADLLAHCPGPYHLRYFNSSEAPQSSRTTVDETGYLFHPPAYDYKIDNYYSEFSGKSIKQIRREIAKLEAHGAAYRYDQLNDVEHIWDLNLMRFGANSYFQDSRFANSFSDLADLLEQKGWLKVVTLIIDGEVAAVDMGCVYNGTYVLFAGGTNPDWPGAAKMINLHHMELACRMRYKEVDFLCGDFNWKKNFHLTPRPLYQISSPAAERADACSIPNQAA